jgi:S1-C subfamily serine protease
MTKGDPKETVKADPQPPVVTNQTPITIPGAGDATAKADEKKTDEPKAEEKKPETPVAATKADDKKPEAKPETKADDAKAPAAKPAEPAKADDPNGSMTSSEKRRLYLSGEMDDVTLKQVKNRTVLIRCESKFGGGAEGSGWFGLEDNIVITNAHVISMIAPNSPPPAKLTIFVNAGEKGQNPGVKEREIPHQRIKILAVDRYHDIAILQISGEKDLPTPFKVKPTVGLRENQVVSIIGFPLGSIMSRGATPVVSVRKSSVSALRYEENGILRKLQVQGGITPGNSGGPNVDADGDVIGMTVQVMTRDINLGLSVPTEHIVGLMAGRVDGVELNTAFLKDGMVHVPFKINIQDPMKRLRGIGLGAWIGDTNGQIRPPGQMRKGIVNSDKDYKEVTVKFEPGSSEARGVVVMAPLAPGQSYWLQPFYQNAIVAKYYLPGTKVELKGPPVELVPASLIANLRPGNTRPFTLVRNSAEDDYAEGEGNDKEDRVRTVITMKGTEQIIARAQNDTQSAARLRLKYNDVDYKQAVGRMEDKLPTRLLKHLKDHIGELESFAYVNRSGSIYKTSTNVLGVRDPIMKVIGPEFSSEVLRSLQECSIPMPNKECTPNETWGDSKTIQYTLNFLELVRKNSPGNGRPNRPGDDDPNSSPLATQVVSKREFLFQQEVKYIYEGTRVRGGRKEAVVRVEGKVTPAAGRSKDSAAGMTKGFAFVDIASGVVLEAEIESEFELDTSHDGLKQRSYSINEYKLTRDGNVR